MKVETRRYFLIDHRILFLFGFVFYLVTPFLVGTNNIFQGFPGMALYQGFFQLIAHEKLVSYLQITLCWIPAFFLGHYIFKLFQSGKRNLHLFPASTTTDGVHYVAYLLLVLLAIFTYTGRNSLFGGYGSYDISARGKLSTLLVICNFFLLYQLLSRQRVSYLLIGCTVFTAVLLLSMGGRMYVFQTFIIYLVYKTSFAAKRWNVFQIAISIMFGFLIGAFAGIWRMGASFGFERAVYSFLAEPLFTWFSTSTFLISNNIPAINLPVNFLTSFLNLVPNTVIHLNEYIVSVKGMGYTYQSPLGADSIWTTLIINFGWIGSILFIFFTGFLLNFLRHIAETSRFWAVYYILICGMLPFQLFRDGFYIINKQLFFNFLLLPGIILVLLKTVVLLQRSIKRVDEKFDMSVNYTE